MPSPHPGVLEMNGRTRATRVPAPLKAKMAKTPTRLNAHETSIASLTPTERQEVEDRISPVGVVADESDRDFRAAVAAKGRKKYGGPAVKCEADVPSRIIPVVRESNNSDKPALNEPEDGEASEYEDLWHGPKRKRLYTMAEVLCEGPRWMSESEAADLLILKNRLAYEALGWDRIREERVARMASKEESTMNDPVGSPDQAKGEAVPSDGADALHEDKARPLSALSETSMYIDSVERFSNAVAGIQLEQLNISTEFFDGSKWYPKQ